MRRLKVVFLAEAAADIDDVFRTVWRGSKSLIVAKGFVRRIRDRCHRIGDVPRGGRPRDDLEPGLRTVPFERSAVIAYKVETDRVTITNIFYGGQDYESLYASIEDDPAGP